MKLILDHTAVQQKINRMAYELYERYFSFNRIVFAGIEERGAELGKHIKAAFDRLQDAPPSEFISLQISKDAPLNQQVILSADPGDCKDACVVLVDDVLNSGRTLFFAMQPFMQMDVRQLSVLVLVNRSHRRFPVAADVVGMHLATTLLENVKVLQSGDSWEVYLEA